MIGLRAQLVEATGQIADTQAATAKAQAELEALKTYVAELTKKLGEAQKALEAAKKAEVETPPPPAQP